MPTRIRTWLGRLTRQRRDWSLWVLKRPSASAPRRAVAAPPGVVSEPIRGSPARKVWCGRPILSRVSDVA
jgi:hypothetical protein